VTDQQRLHDKRWSLIVARAWADEDFKGRLLADPRAVLCENGMEIEPDVPVSVIEATETVDYDQALMNVRRFILPANPGGDLCEEELGPVGVAYCYCGGCGRCGRCGCGCGRCGCYE